MAAEIIKDLDDERIQAYHNLKDKQLAQDLGLFVVEGEHLVRRLLASDLSVPLTANNWKKFPVNLSITKDYYNYERR